MANKKNFKRKAPVLKKDQPKEQSKEPIAESESDEEVCLV